MQHNLQKLTVLLTTKIHLLLDTISYVYLNRFAFTDSLIGDIIKLRALGLSLWGINKVQGCSQGPP